MSYRADKLRVDAHPRTHTQTDAGNDNIRKPKLASGKKHKFAFMRPVLKELHRLTMTETLDQL